VIGVGIVGCGYWGANLVRNFSKLADARIVGVCDLSQQRLNAVLGGAPGIRTYCRYRDLISDPKVDAVVVATPAGTHYSVALESLRAGKHVLVAKPLATSSRQAQELHQQASKRGLTLMVGHTFVYSGAVRAIRDVMAAGVLGDLLYYDSSRANLGVFQPDVNVLWDLAVHDLSILDFLLDEQPVAISATGARHLAGQLDNLAVVTLFYPGSRIAHIHVSWLAPVKLRRIHIGGSRRMIVYDETRSEQKVTIHDKGVVLDPSVEAGRPEVCYRDDGVTAAEIDPTEPLYTEAAHFVDCVAQGTAPLTGAPSGLRIVSLLEAATRSLEQRGRLIDLPAVGSAAAARQPGREPTAGDVAVSRS